MKVKGKSKVKGHIKVKRSCCERQMKVKGRMIFPRIALP